MGNRENRLREVGPQVWGWEGKGLDVEGSSGCNIIVIHTVRSIRSEKRGSKRRRGFRLRKKRTRELETTSIKLLTTLDLIVTHYYRVTKEGKTSVDMRSSTSFRPEDLDPSSLRKGIKEV